MMRSLPTSGTFISSMSLQFSLFMNSPIIYLFIDKRWHFYYVIYLFIIDVSCYPFAAKFMQS